MCVHFRGLEVILICFAPLESTLLINPETVSAFCSLFLSIFSLSRSLYLAPTSTCFESNRARHAVPVRKKGITSILLTSFANISYQNQASAASATNHSHHHHHHATSAGTATGPGATAAAAAAAATSSTGKDGNFFFESAAAGGGTTDPNKTRKNDYYIGNAKNSCLFFFLFCFV